MLPGTALFTVGTAGLTSDGNKWIYLAVVVVLAVFVFGTGYWLKKKYIKGE